ncbi:MAG: HEAT repeat domain-containing protein [Ktedonobacteraceae bacterium]|nr:HEAT repeat domain-containing protein [Ktedonobacteraceae bacterium]
MSTEDLTQLIKDCQSGDPEKQNAAIFALDESEVLEALPVLLHLLLSDPDKTVRANVAFTLAILDEQEPQPATLGPALLKALDDDGEKVRARAAGSLGYLHYLPAAHRLRGLLHNDSAWFVRLEAAQALGRLGDEASIPDLQQAVTDSDPQMQREGVIALGQFIDSPPVAPFVAAALAGEVQDLTVKAELLALSYRLGHRSHLQDLLALFDQAKDDDLATNTVEDYDELATNLIEVLMELTDKKTGASIPPEDKAAIQKTLQKTQRTHPSLLSDIERIRRHLK